MTDEKRRAGRDLPFINWRYILFRWNDSAKEMDHARVLAEQIGVDRLSWEITDHPESAYSRRFTPGSPDHAAIRREIWDDSNLGSAIAGATPRARIDVRRLVPGLPLMGPRSGRIQIAHACAQSVDPAVPGPSVLRPPPRASRRAALRR